ncbi:MAG: tetratricopeptide repeat protein, partial [Acidobacteriota bacterium]|nr:tetratricopeptide repeat protein [Acidobacteriota bacterium]
AVILGYGLVFISCSSQSKQKHLTRGEEYLQKRKFQEAVMEFRAASDIDNLSAEAHWGLARAFENLGQFYETIEELRSVTELNAENLEAKTRLGNYFLLTQPPQTNETAKILDDIFALDANFIEGHILKASLLAAQQKSEKEVLAVLNYAVSLNPNRTETYLSVARYFMKLGQAKEAEKAIQKAILVKREIALGYLEYGRFLEYANRPDEAEAQFKKAIEVEPKNIEAREAQAEFYLADKQFDKAESAYNELIQIEENSPESRMKLANFYAHIGRENDAVAVFNEIVAELPEYVRARYRLGEIYLDRKENEKVNEQVAELLKFNDNDTEAVLLRARVKLQENRADEAIKDLEEVLKKQPSQKNALFFMTQARLSLGQVDQARTFIGDLEKYHPGFLKTKLLKIQTSFTVGESENALRGANELLKAVKGSFPNAETDAQGLEELRVRALTARGLANLEIGELGEARIDLQEIVRLSPNSSAATVNLAKVAVAKNNWTEAINLYEKALMADGKNFDALSGLVRVLTRQKRFDQAQTKIDGVMQTANTEVLPALHYLKADVFTAQKNVAAAESELKTAIELDENYLPAYSAYAAILIARNQIDEAVGQYKKVVEKKPSAAVYTLIIMLEDARNSAAEAEKNYRRALEIAPETPIAANNLAWLIASGEGNLDEALTLAQTTVNKNQNVAGYYDTLGWVYYKKGLYSPAAQQFKKAVALDEVEASRTNGSVNLEYRLRLAAALSAANDKSL